MGLFSQHAPFSGSGGLAPGSLAWPCFTRLLRCPHTHRSTAGPYTKELQSGSKATTTRAGDGCQEGTSEGRLQFPGPKPALCKTLAPLSSLSKWIPGAPQGPSSRTSNSRLLTHYLQSILCTFPLCTDSPHRSSFSHSIRSHLCSPLKLAASPLGCGCPISLLLGPRSIGSPLCSHGVLSFMSCL